MKEKKLALMRMMNSMKCNEDEDQRNEFMRYRKEEIMRNKFE